MAAMSPAPPEALGPESQSVTSPGPLHMSDLDTSLPGPMVSMPRRLEPLEAPKKKRKRKKKELDSLPVQQTTTDSLLNEDLRSQLRSRLDPLYNPIPPSQPSEGAEGLTTPTDERERGEISKDLGGEEQPLHGDSINQEELAGTGRELPPLPSDTEDPPQSRAHLMEGETPQHTSADLQAYLSEEDVIDVTPEDHMPHTLTLPHPHTHKTNKNSIVFVERKDGRGFVARRRGRATSPVGEAWLSWSDKEITSEQVTLFVHGVIQRLSLIAHGLLAGVSLWDCVVSNVLAAQSGGHVELLTVYHLLTLPLHAVYLLLLLLVTVSLSDRLDLAQIDRSCLRSLIYPSKLFPLIALLLALLALLLTLSVAAIDERIFLYPQLPTLWLDILEPVNASLSPLPVPTTHTADSLVYTPASPPVSSLVTSWLGVVIVRAILCCSSWFLTIYITGTDRLQGYLSSIMTGGDTREHS